MIDGLRKKMERKRIWLPEVVRTSWCQGAALSFLPSTRVNDGSTTPPHDKILHDLLHSNYTMSTYQLISREVSAHRTVLQAPRSMLGHDLLLLGTCLSAPRGINQSTDRKSSKDNYVRAPEAQRRKQWSYGQPKCPPSLLGCHKIHRSERTTVPFLRVSPVLLLNPVLPLHVS